MTLHISEAEVRATLTMPMAIQAVEEISRKTGDGRSGGASAAAFELPGGGFFHYMAAADYSAGFIAMKQYTYVRGVLRFVVPLYEMGSGELVAMIEADYMGQLRTGAAFRCGHQVSGAQKFDGSWNRGERRASQDATGGDRARSRSHGSTCVQPRRREREAFAKEMTERIGVLVQAVGTASEACASGGHRLHGDNDDGAGGAPSWNLAPRRSLEGVRETVRTRFGSSAPR